MARTVATAPKRWPKNAEAFRLDSIATASRADRMLQDAREAVRRNQAAEAMYLVAEAQLLVREISEMLRQAKGGKA